MQCANCKVIVFTTPYEFVLHHHSTQNVSRVCSMNLLYAIKCPICASHCSTFNGKSDSHTPICVWSNLYRISSTWHWFSCRFVLSLCFAVFVQCFYLRRSFIYSFIHSNNTISLFCSLEKNLVFPFGLFLYLFLVHIYNSISGA